MLGTGRQVIAAPKGSAVASTSIGTGDGSATIFNYGGDTVLTTALAAGAVGGSPVSIVVTSGGEKGFTNSSTVIFEPGTVREEELVLHSTASDGAGDLNLAANQTVKYAHAIGSRVVSKLTNAPLRPGSVVVLQNAAASGMDDGNGNLVAVSGASPSATGTVDYTTGVIKATFSAAPAMSKAVTYTANTCPADASIDDTTGQGFFKNSLGMRLNRRDVPDEVALINLGDSEVGVFMQKSRNKGKTFVDSGTSVKLPPRGRKIITPDGGFYDQLRIRACSAVDTVGSNGARTANTKEASIVEVTPLYSKLDNGQA